MFATAGAEMVVVFTVERASESDLIAHDRHERLRLAETSEIDPERTPENRVLVGPASPKEAVERYVSRIRPASRRQEEPYVRIVVSASPGYFRPAGDAKPGTWDAERLAAWEASSYGWLNATFGADLVHLALHLDETTPHMHAFIVPTYDKKARIPGRQMASRGETEDAFAQRRAAARGRPPERAISYSSNTVFKRRDSFNLLRRSYADALAHLGLGYGRDAATVLEEGGLPATPTGAKQFLAKMVVSNSALKADLECQMKSLEEERDRLQGALGAVETRRSKLHDIAVHLEDEVQRRVERTLAGEREVLSGREATVAKKLQDADAREGELRDKAAALDQRHRSQQANSVALRSAAGRLRDVLNVVSASLGVDTSAESILDALEEVERLADEIERPSPGRGGAPRFRR